MEGARASADWLELSGLPEQLNAVRANGWLVFKTIVELDCRLNRQPDAVEISLDELGARCGLDWEKTAKVVLALQKKKYLACFVPDNPDEEGLFQVRVPVRTPRSADEVAMTATDPYLRDATTFRYVAKPVESSEQTEKVQKVLDLYLNQLSQKVNSFIVDQVEVIAQRFPIEAIERTIERAARHEIRSIGWVAKELIRDAAKPKQNPAQAAPEF